MPFRYRYPGEDWKETRAESYTLEKIYGRPYFNFYCEATSADERLPGGVGAEVSLISHVYLEGWMNSYRLITQSYSWGVWPEISTRRSYGGGSDETVGILLVPRLPGFNRDSRNAVIYSGNPQWNYRKIERGSIRNRRFVYTDEPPYSDDFYCIFSLFNSSGNQYYHKTTLNVCPEIEDENNKCPEGTCEVICGDTICCYGSDGIAVTSFPRT